MSFVLKIERTFAKVLKEKKVFIAGQDSEGGKLKEKNFSHVVSSLKESK